jgi:hypothetical protein
MKIYKIINKYFLELIFFLIFLIFVCYFYKSFSNDFSTSNYSYNELFINYHSGFIRRGLVGEIFFKLNSILDISHKVFFCLLFITLYTLEIILFYIILKKLNNFKILIILIIFSPALLLFSIYDTNVYFAKDVIIKISILFHAIIINTYKNNLEKYSIYLKYFIIPFLFFIILFIHEYQVLFISIHVLFTFYVNHKNKICNKYNLNYYLILIIPFSLVLLFIGNKSDYQNLTNFLNLYDVEIHQQIGLGFKGLLGGFYKWHFYYFSYRDFIQLLFSFFLSIGCYYFLFHYFMLKKIIIVENEVKEKYILFFIPTLFIFLNIDHGRNLSLLSTHLVIFYLIQDFNKYNLQKFFKDINEKFFIKNLLYIFIFIYLFLWILPQNAGFGGKEQINSIFKSSIFAEVIKAVKFIYYFVDKHLISLPEIKL